MKNRDYIASGEYEGEFYLIERLNSEAYTVARHSDGHCFAMKFAADGLTGLRASVKKHGELKTVASYARAAAYMSWRPLYKAGILRNSESAKAAY